MLIADILHSCSDEGIAQAAVTSIGGSFAREMRAEAARSEQALGAFAASLVRGFANGASERDWRDLKAATRGSEVPVLGGLALIATTMMARRTRTDAGIKATNGPRCPAAATVDAAVSSRLKRRFSRDRRDHTTESRFRQGPDLI